MLVEVKVPQLSESVAEATLVSWHRKVGDFVKRDEDGFLYFLGRRDEQIVRRNLVRPICRRRNHSE